MRSMGKLRCGMSRCIVACVWKDLRVHQLCALGEAVEHERKKRGQRSEATRTAASPAFFQIHSHLPFRGVPRLCRNGPKRGRSCLALVTSRNGSGKDADGTSRSHSPNRSHSGGDIANRTRGDRSVPGRSTGPPAPQYLVGPPMMLVQ